MRALQGAGCDDGHNGPMYGPGRSSATRRQSCQRVQSPLARLLSTPRCWLWHVRDDRPFAGQTPPAVLYRYSPDRKGEHPRTHLGPFRGILQADGYQGYARLCDRGVCRCGRRR